MCLLRISKLAADACHAERSAHETSVNPMCVAMKSISGGDRRSAQTILTG